MYPSRKGGEGDTGRKRARRAWDRETVGGKGRIGSDLRRKKENTCSH